MKPATALPWCTMLAPQGGMYLRGFDCTDVARLGLDINHEQPQIEQNARYLSHAANAYPHLVAALQGLFKECAMVHKHWGDGSNAKEANAAQTAALCLLVSLGEET